MSEVSTHPAAEAPPQSLAEWNRTERDYPLDRCVHQLFEQQAEKTPDNVAVTFEETTLTYRELNRRANQLAHHLVSLGVGPDVLVGLCLERSLELMVALLGILKAGGAYVPLDPAYPADRLAFMLADAGASVLVTQRRLAGLWGSPPGRVVCLDTDWPEIARARFGTPEVAVLPANRAYVIYTSGSTGKPKGVVVLHRGLTNYLAWCAEAYAPHLGIGAPVHSSISFDLTITSLFPPLLAGKRVDMLPEDPHGIETLSRALTRNSDYSFVKITPAHLALLAEQLPPAVAARAARRFIIGGENLAGGNLAFWQEHAPQTILINEYGPTETVVGSCVYQVGQNERIAGSVPIGRPIANTQVYLLDRQLKPVPAGAAGELHLGGVGVAGGYLNRPELTAERFIPHPFSGDANARLYKTGDLARWRADGNLEFLGRADQQVKIRGFRIELGEIETVLGAHPAVTACGVSVQEHGGGVKVLVAYVVSRQKGEPSHASLQQWLGRKLPDYMIPSRFILVPALPLNVNGKVDRPALARLGGVELPASTEFTAPHNQREQVLLEIWRAVLRRETLGVRDNFFDLGGHSLLAVVICSQIHQRLRMAVPLRWVFEFATIESLSGQMAALETAAPPGGGGLGRADRQKPLPVSFGQQQMWLLQHTLPDPAAYHVPVACRLSGPVDREKVRHALRKITERHELLRTALSQSGEHLVQQIAAAETVPLPWQETDLSGVPANRREIALAEHLQAWVSQPFDLARAPLWRVEWIQLAGEEQVLAFNFHHSIMDEWSLRLFYQELQRLYETNGEAGLPELPVQYADYAVWQREQLTGALLEQHGNYWREQLRDLPPDLELPVDRPRPLQPSSRGLAHSFQLASPVADGLRKLALQEKTTVFTIVLAAFQVWLYRSTGQMDVVVGTPAASRERPEVQHLLGYFLNTLPIRVRLDGGQSFRETLHQVRQNFLDACSHAQLPFEQMAGLVSKERTAAYQPLYQVMFVLLEEGLPPLRLDQTPSQPVPVETRTCKNNLVLSIQATDRDWNCQLDYAADLFSADRMAGMARQLTELLGSISQNADKPISQLNLLSEAERRQILVEWNRTEREYPQDKCIHKLFEEQAQLAPDAVAVVFAEGSLTYRELNARADLLAGHLRSLGVGAEALVGLAVERSFEMVIGVLAILKAGGAYWALEENLPENRLRLMLADARPRVLLARRESASRLAGLISTDLPVATCPVVVIEELLATSPAPLLPAAPASRAGDPAYVSYTSGSTGRPKGVVVPHRGVVRLVKGADYVSLDAEAVVLHLSPLSFDASTFELWGPLLNGGRVVLLPPGPPALADIGAAIRRHGVTTLWLTAGLFHLMVDEKMGDLKPLRQLLAGGDVLSPEHVRRARRALPGCRIINGYGPTENTTFTCCHTVADEDELTPNVPIGRPIANTQVYVLDPEQQPVPAGVAGELYAGGDGVACGYLHQPELTAERFLPDPFSGRPGARLYRTGDLVRWRPNGSLEFLGRMDAQVKIRGFRVELGEIEAGLRSQPGVREAVVIVHAAPSGDKRLTAYLVTQASEKPADSQLRAGLAKTLPNYMIPSAFVWLDQFPLNANGKVNRQALTAPAITGGATHAPNPPANLLELEFTRIWRRLFQREDIGRHDNFFALGGHSLLAVRLAAEIDRLTGGRLPLVALFQSPTIESLVQRFTDESWAPPWSSLVPLQPKGTKPPLFFVHGVGGEVYIVLELVRQLGPDQPCYGIQAVGLDGKTPRHTTVEEMAAHYVKEIISFQPQGPVCLAGYSLGGTIAYEVARQLHCLGRQVAFLGLLDSGPVGKTSWVFYGLAMATYLPGRCWLHFQQWWKLPLGKKHQYLQGRWMALQHWLKQNQSKPTPVTAPPPDGAEPPPLPGFLDYYHAVAYAYRPGSYPGSADIFFSDDDLSGWRWRWYWRHLVRGGTSFHRVPGRHWEIFSPANLPVLVNVFSNVLQAKQKKAAGESSGGK